MEKIVDFVNLLGWVFLLIHVTSQIILQPAQFAIADISLDVYVLKGIQLFQTVDILLIFLGKSKGSIAGAFFQILGRLTVAIVFIQTDSNQFKFAAVVIAWAIADINRYLYYLFKNDITGFLRYNFFLILYPLGVYAEMVIINDYIKRHAEQLEQGHVNSIRGIQGAILIGVIFLYAYMLKMRNKYYKNRGRQGKKEDSVDQNRSRSPKPKRN